jgi:hypothetical protein
MKYLTAILCTAAICATAVYCVSTWPTRYAYHDTAKIIDRATGRIYRVYGTEPTTARDPVAEINAQKQFDPDAYLATKTNAAGK